MMKIDNNATKFWLWAGLIYIVLQLISISIQFLFPIEREPFENKHQVEIHLEEAVIELSYISFKSKNNLPPVVIFPDLMRGTDEAIGLAREISESQDALIFLYPERNSDGSRISHSIQSRAEFGDLLLKELGITEYHLTGIGYGGAVLKSGAGNFDQANSYTFINSMGVVEFEFLGGHRINSTVYSLMVPLHGFIKYLMPHAGWFHHQPIDQNFVRSKNSLDLRNIREALSKIDTPVLIIQNEDADRVQKAAAEEHHRLIPQSELLLLQLQDKSFSEITTRYHSAMMNFIDQTKAGESTDRPNASAERIEKSEEPFDPDDTPTAEGIALLILILLIASISLFSEDLACVAAGLAVASGLMAFWYAVLAAFIGIFTADIVVYWLGRGIGSPALRWIPFRWLIKEKDILWAEHMFDKNGLQIIFASRFLPGTRFPVYFSAGMVKSHFGYFALYFFAALLVWTPLIIGITTILGQRMLVYLDHYQDYAVLILIILVTVIFLIIKFVTPLATKKGRKEFAVKVIRFKERIFG